MKKVLAVLLAVLLALGSVSAFAEGIPADEASAAAGQETAVEEMQPSLLQKAAQEKPRPAESQETPSEMPAREEEPIEDGQAVPAIRAGAISEYYSMDGYYTDGVGNSYLYSYHVPQIHADSADAEEINAQLREQFGKQAEWAMKDISSGTSITVYNITWSSYWNGSQLFLLVSALYPNDMIDYAVAGYDFEKDCRITNEMLLEQLGIPKEDYLLNLREKAGLAFESEFPALRQTSFYYDMLHRTISDENLENAMLYLDGGGTLIAVVKIYSGVGAGWYYGLITPFAYG